jgi:hypothetical protein
MTLFKHITNPSSLLAVFVLIGGAVLGCGGDKDDNNSNTSAGTGSGGTAGANGGSGATGTAGTSGTAGTTASSTCVATTTCNQACDVTTFSAKVSAQYMSMACLKACCTTDNKCGAQLMGMGTGAMLLNGGSCVELGQTGTNDPTGTKCPGTTTTTAGDAGTSSTSGFGALLGNLFKYTGCCRPDGKCGLDLAELGLGCVANENIKNISPLFGTLVTAKACTP